MTRMLRNWYMRLRVGGEPLAAAVTRVSYSATLCEPFRLVVELAVQEAGAILHVTEGAEATFECDDEPFVRSIRGVVVRVQEWLTDHPHYEITIVPALWLTGLRTNHRLFHDSTVVEIADRILVDHGPELGPFRPVPLGTLRKREYRVQAKESDLSFISRLFADEGLTHFYDHITDGWVVVDDTRALSASAVRVPFIENRGLAPSGDARVPHVHAVSVATSRVESGVAVRDYDFRRPALALDGREGLGPREAYVPDHGVVSSVTDATVRASYVFEALSARKKTYQLQANFVLAPGSTLMLEGAPRDDANTVLLVTACELRFDGEQLSSQLVCVEAASPWRPHLRAKPRFDGVDTGVVVGDIRQVVDVDSYGRILVRFHWDRDNKASCRVRVSQTLAGGAFGAQFIPRIGMEVLVSYIDGDPDQPVVTGCVYNGENPTPFMLPADATRSGFRTVSIPDGQRRQEISFEDRAHVEMLHIEAARNMEVLVPRDKSISVGATLTSSVGSDASFAVGGNQTEGIAGSSLLNVGGDCGETVDGAHRLTVGTDNALTVGGDRSVSIGGTDTMIIGKPNADGMAAWTIHGTFALNVDGEAAETLVTSAKCIRFRCGDSEIVLTPDEIRIVGKHLAFSAKESLVAIGNGPCLTLGENAMLTAKKCELLTPGAWICLDEKLQLVSANTTLSGGPLPNAPKQKDDASKPKTFQVALRDPWHKPYDSLPYTLTVDGERFEGETSDDGKVEHDVNPLAKAGSLTLWLDGTPGKGKTVHWPLALHELPPVETPEGLRRRLTSLGYLRATIRDREAIERFQRDHGLESSGLVDDATRAKVREVAGV